MEREEALDETTLGTRDGRVLVLGGAVRTIQYCGQVSLWHDELAIARNTWLSAWRPRFASAITYLTAAPLTRIVLLAARPPYDSGQEARPIIEELGCLLDTWTVQRLQLRSAA